MGRRKRKLSDGWGLFQTYPTEWHIHPVDEPDHVHCLNDCGCDPQLDEINGVMIFSHSSFDGREAIEMAKEILEDV